MSLTVTGIQVFRSLYRLLIMKVFNFFKLKDLEKALKKSILLLKNSEKY